VTTPPAASSPEIAPASRPSHRLRNFLAAFVLGFALALIAAGAGLAAWDAAYEARVLPGVTIAGVDLSGMDRTQAEAAVEAAFPYGQGQVVLHTPTGDVAVPYSAFGRRPDTTAMVDAAMLAGRGGDIGVRAVVEVRQALDGRTLEPRMLLDEQALAAALEAAVEPLKTTPVNATVTMGSDGPITTSSQDGSDADAGPAIEAALAAVRELDAPDEIVVPVAVERVPPVVDDASVRQAVARAESMVGDVVVKYKKKSVKIPAATVRTWMSFAPAGDGTVGVTVDPALIPATITKLRKPMAVKPQSAVFLKTKSGKVFGVAPGKDGRKLDEEATAALVVAELEARAGGAAPTAVTAAWAPVTPKVTTAEAGKSATVMTKLGAWTTYFPISERNYFGANIWIPARLINGIVLKPGQTFDWWRAVGPVSSSRGFGPGGFIRGTFTDPTGALGGGMCSSSTTLFNAALRAGLRMGARDNHKYYIGRYPLGLDATVWILSGRRQSMSFTNDTKNPILIRGVRTRRGSAGYVTYEIWGKPDGRTVSIGRPLVRNVIKARTRTEYVDTLGHGVREQVEYPSNQMDVSVSRLVRSASGRTLHHEVWQTHYVLWGGIVQIGR